MPKNRCRPFADLFTALEARHVLAGPPDISGVSGQFVDVDGDQVSFRLSGPGTVEVFTPTEAGSGGFAVMDSTEESRLVISVRKAGAGDGRLFMNYIEASNRMAGVSAPKVDLSGGLVLGNAEAISLGRFLNGADLMLTEPEVTSGVRIAIVSVDGAAEDPSQFSLGLRRLESFTVTRLHRLELSAASVGRMIVAATRDPQAGRMQESTVNVGRIDLLSVGRSIVFSTLNFNTVGTLRAGAMAYVDLNVAGVGPSGYSIDALRLGPVEAVNALVAGPIGSVSVVEWVNGGIVATALDRLTVTGSRTSQGDFAAGLALSGVNTSGLAFNRLTVRGLFQGSLTTATSAGDIDVGGFTNASVSIGFNGSDFHPNDLPTSLAGWANPNATLRKLVITKRVSAVQNFVNSVVIAPTIQRLVHVNNVNDVSNGGDVFGILANQINSLKWTTPKVSLTNLSGLGLGVLPPDQLPFPVSFSDGYADASLFGSQPMQDGRLRLLLTVV